MTVLGVDPSTDITGLAVVTFDETDKAELRAVTFIDALVAQKNRTRSGVTKFATADAATAYRLHVLRSELSKYVNELSVSFDALAYEYPQAINAAWGLRPATLDVHRAGGAVLSACVWPDVLPVGTNTARCVYAPGRALPTDKKKAACLAWAAARYGADWTRLTHLCSRLEQEAIADACAVAEAAYKQYLKRAQLSALEKPMAARKKPKD